MKLLLVIGVLIFFISWFFIFFTFDTLLRTEISCSYHETMKCNITELNGTIMAGIVIAGAMLAVDFMVFYIILKFGMT